MGIYYQTVFYPDVDVEDRYVVIGVMDQVIDKNDEERGYILKEEFLQYFGNKISEEDITDKSRIVEYMTTSYDGIHGGKVREFAIK